MVTETTWNNLLGTPGPWFFFYSYIQPSYFFIHRLYQVKSIFLTGVTFLFVSVLLAL